MASQELELSNNYYWFKIVGLLQQNWTFIEHGKENIACTVYFIDDNSGVFDQLEFDNVVEAERQLRVTGFERFVENNGARTFIAPPPAPFHRSIHPSGPIYSSGRYWDSR